MTTRSRGEAERDEPEARGHASGLWEQISTLLIAVAIALAIRAFLVEPYRIPSGSMFPTLLVGDHLFVNKFVYGIKVPFTDLRLPGLRAPERGEVVVRVRVRGAQQVSLAGEWADWTPVTLRRIKPNGDRWEGTLTLAPGTYRFNIIVDGGRWTLPDGVTSVPDGLGGHAGVLVVPGPAR